MSIYQRLGSSKDKIAFVDIDYTLSNHATDTDVPQLLDHKLTNKARQLLEQHGFLVVFVTSRTEEMLMTKHEYELSVLKYHLNRPVPLFGMKSGKRFYMPPEKFEPDGILNPDIIASCTGGKIFVHQSDGGYAEDVDYRAELAQPTAWRTQTMKQLKQVNSEKNLFSFNPIEYEENYQKGITDVFPPDYRIQISFQNFANLIEFKTIFTALESKLHSINESTPEKNKYSLYISPKKGKYEAVNRIIQSLNSLRNADQIEEILYIGDSLPDLYGGLHIDAENSTLFLVGGSRLSQYIIDPNKNDFAGDDLSEIKKYIKKNAPGMYIYQRGAKVCQIIVSDEKYPGLVGPESLIEYFL